MILPSNYTCRLYSNSTTASGVHYKENVSLTETKLNEPKILLPFCGDILNWPIVSAPHDYGKVWVSMDDIALQRYNSYISGVSEDCKAAIKQYMCILSFNPCDSKGNIENPIQKSLIPVCAAINVKCDFARYHKLCTFDVPIPPDPSGKC